MSDPFMNDALSFPPLPELPTPSVGTAPLPPDAQMAPPTMPGRRRIPPEVWVRLATAIAAMALGTKRGGGGLAMGMAQGLQQNLENQMRQQQLDVQQQRMNEDAAQRQQILVMQQRNQQSAEQSRLSQERARLYKLASDTLGQAETPEEYKAATQALYAEASALPGLNIRPGTFEALHPFVDQRLAKWAQGVVKTGADQLGGLDKWLAAKPVYDTPEDYGPSQRLSAQDLLRFLKVSLATDVAGQPMMAPVDEPATVKTARAEAGVLFEAKYGRKPDPENPKDTKALTRLLADQINPPKAPPAAMPSGYDNPKIATRVDRMVTQFDNNPTVKKFNTVIEGARFAMSLPDNTTNPADDQALIYAFAKAMDPDSVVREGEYAVVQKYSQSWAEAFGFNARRVVENSEFLTVQARKNIKKTIAQKYAAMKPQYENMRGQFTERIKRLLPESDATEFLGDYDIGLKTGEGKVLSTDPGAGTPLPK